MALKIKWNDDRVKQAGTAVLLGCRGQREGGRRVVSVEEALTEFREDMEGHREKFPLRERGAAREAGGVLTGRAAAEHLAMGVALERAEAGLVQNKRQFNSLRELDNFLIATLSGVGTDQNGGGPRKG